MNKPLTLWIVADLPGQKLCLLRSRAFLLGEENLPPCSGQAPAHQELEGRAFAFWCFMSDTTMIHPVNSFSKS